MENVGQYITKYVKGKVPKALFENPSEESLPYLSPDYLRGKANPEFYAIPNNRVVEIDDGEVIILWDGSNAGEVFISKKGILGSTMVKLEFDEEEIFKPYFSYSFQYLEYFLKAKTAGSGIPHADKGVIKKLDFFKPPKPEQTAIASLLSKVDEAIEATQNSIKAAEKLKKALMQNLLTGKLKPDGTWRKDDEFYEDEKFGKVPNGWEVKNLKDIFFVNLNTLPSQTEANYTFKYITIEAVNTENIDFESCPEYLFKESPGRARRVINSGDILISGVRPNLKAFSIYEKPNDENWICSTGFYVLTVREDENNKFHFYQILSEIGEKQFHSYVAGSNYPAIGDRDIKLLKLYRPPYDEQCLIEEKINSLSAVNQNKQTKIQTLQRLKKSLMQNLLTGKVRLPEDFIALFESTVEVNHKIEIA